jgi:hypothetical protein
MGTLRRAALALALFLLAVTPCRAWEAVSRDGISVEFAPADDLAAERVLEIATAASRRLHEEMGVRDAGPVRIVIAPDETAFADLTGGALPEWGVGVAYPSRGTIVLRSPRIVEYPLALGQIVVHEVAHVATERGLRGVRAPRWFHEGVAMMSAGEWRLGRLDAMVARVGGGGVIPLSELDASFPYDSSDASAAYVQSFFAVNHLAERSGIGTASGVVRAIAAAGSFDAGIERLTGESRTAFERSALTAMRRSFSLPLLLRTGDLMFVLLAVLLIVALVIKIRSSRRKMKALADEDGGGPRWSPGSDSSWQ